MESRNPFAKRNGRIITINDLAECEKGLKCGCECPVCGGTFIARMGEIRTKHFAHSGEPCDIIKQMINSTYQLVAQALTECGYFYFPALYAYCDLKQFWTSYYEDYKISPFSKQNYARIFDKGKMAIHSVEIINNSADVSTVIIVDEQLALRLAIETEYCIETSVGKYEDMPTLCINIDDVIYRENIKLLMKRIIAETDNKYWIWSPKLARWLDVMEKERIEKYDEHLKYVRALEEQRGFSTEKQKKEMEARVAKEKQRAELRGERDKTITQESDDYRSYIPKKKKVEYHVKMKWCSVCRQQCHPDDTLWGRNTRKFYCQKCIAEKGLDWRAL